MRKSSQAGSLLIPLILVVVLFLGAASFGVWAYMERADYKNNSDQKSAEAVALAEEALTKKKDAEFAEREKDPNKTYTGPTTYGTITFKYPKTWSAYVAEDDKSQSPVNGYFYPDFVPNVQGDTAYAVRVTVTNSVYATDLKQFEQNVKTGKTKVNAYKFEKVPNVLMRIDGLFSDNRHAGTMIMMPLRDKTIKIWSENPKFMSDFEKLILPSLTFVP